MVEGPRSTSIQSSKWWNKTSFLYKKNRKEEKQHLKKSKAVHQRKAIYLRHMIVWTRTITHFRLPISSFGQWNLVKMFLKDLLEFYTNFPMIWMGRELMHMTAVYSFRHLDKAQNICSYIWLTAKTDRNLYHHIKLSSRFSASWQVYSFMAFRVKDMTQSRSKNRKILVRHTGVHSYCLGLLGSFCLHNFICPVHRCCNIQIIF